jgi:four helix bundle protein
MFEFDFEKLNVYKTSIANFRKVLALTRSLPRDLQFSLADQLRRAALSISNNIAEGSGKESKKEKAYFYSTSLHSARECIPMFTILYEEQIVGENDYVQFRQNIVEITSMLRGLIGSVRQYR